MTKEFIGREWSFPPKVGPQGGLLLTNKWNEIDHSIRIILMNAIGQRVMRTTFGCRIHELVNVT